MGNATSSSGNDSSPKPQPDGPNPDNLSKADLSAVKKALNDVAGKSGFRCETVSWEDAQRGTVGGAVSCWGGNISDVRLWEKNGTLLYTLRSDNWNERLGYVSSADVAVVTGNHVPGGQPFQPVTLRSFLKNFGKYASYAGAECEQLWDEEADQLLTIRFQAVFLPISSDETTEFCTDVYNYNTHSDNDPRNTLLLCTAQGTSVQQDGSGEKKLFIHNVDPSGVVHRYWLEAERSTHKVGGAQKETNEEAAAAAARGKATAMHIGTKAMGTRFNVQMLIQLPCKQKQTRSDDTCSDSSMSESVDDEDDGTNEDGSMPLPSSEYECCATEEALRCDDEEAIMPLESIKKEADLYQSLNDKCDVYEEEKECSKMKKKCISSESRAKKSTAREVKKPTLGTSNAARVSRGSEEDTWKGINNKAPVRDPSQHGTITVTLYYTVAGGIPSPADVEACVADLDSLYKACPSDKKLVDCSEVTAELTVKDMQDIGKKLTEQPYGSKNE